MSWCLYVCIHRNIKIAKMFCHLYHCCKQCLNRYRGTQGNVYLYSTSCLLFGIQITWYPIQHNFYHLSIILHLHITVAKIQCRCVRNNTRKFHGISHFFVNWTSDLLSWRLQNKTSTARNIVDCPSLISCGVGATRSRSWARILSGWNASTPLCEHDTINATGWSYWTRLEQSW